MLFSAQPNHEPIHEPNHEPIHAALPARLLAFCCPAILYPVLLLFTIFFPDNAHAQSRPVFLDDHTTYHWPTNASRYMSSSFGETRASHFHAAMDIGTWGHEGYAVFAARDGILHRIGIGPVGYGNVIYLRHNDGSQSIYAHLKDFHPRIRAVVDSLRMKDYSFDFNRNMEDFQLHFKRGQQIGWTGSTGVGPPHLHFELRSPEGRPFNPLLAGLSIVDTIPPQFSGLAVEPLSPTSLVNGSPLIHRSRPSREGGIYQFGTITVQGETGLAVNVFDRANASNNIHAVYELKMFVNDELYFHSRADSFSYHQTRQMFLDRVFPILKNERRGYQRLYVRDGNSLPFYLETGQDGRLNLPVGEYDISIIASDFFGNQARARLRLDVLEADSPNIKKHISFPERHNVLLQTNPCFTHAGNQSPPENLIWHKNWVRPGPVTRENSDPVAISLRPLGAFRDEMVTYTSADHGIPLDMADRMELRKENHCWVLHRIRPHQPATVHHHDMRTSIHFPINAFFEPLSLGITGKYPDFTIFPDIEPFQRPAHARIVLNEDFRNRKGIGLYSKNPENGNLSFVSSALSRDGSVLSGTIASAGTYTIQRDTIPPTISGPNIGKWNHNSQYYVTVQVTDDLSGIDYPSARFYVNGLRGIAEYDPEKKILRYHRPGFVPGQMNSIRVILNDRSGNTADKSFMTGYDR